MLDDEVQEAQERITVHDGDEWTCVCGNEAESDGFTACLPNGLMCEPIGQGGQWASLYLCRRCDRIIDQTTHLVVPREPEFKITHCPICGAGLQATIKMYLGDVEATVVQGDSGGWLHVTSLGEEEHPINWSNPCEELDRLSVYCGNDHTAEQMAEMLTTGDCL